MQVNCTVPLKWIEYGVYRDLILTYPKPYSIYDQLYAPVGSINQNDRVGRLELSPAVFTFWVAVKEVK